MKKIVLFLVSCFLLGQVFGQLSGTYTIPGSYATIAAAITDLNTLGVAAPGATFNVAAGYTELLTARLNLTATGTSSAPIIFQKSGVGLNPLITAYTGANLAGTATPDGMWSLTGSDYVTIDGIDLQDAATNLTPTTQMEYGYGLFKASTTDGANNNAIKNCTVTLNRNNNTAGAGPFANSHGSVGIVVMDCTPITATTVLTITATSGASSNNQFYSNTIQNVNTGIALYGYAGPVPFNLCDVNNDIGGSSPSTGNNVINFGGGSGATNAAAGAVLTGQWNFNVSYNTVNNNNGSGVNHPALNRGIWASAASGANGNINYNAVTMKGGGTTTQISCIENGAGAAGVGNTMNINNNTIINCTNTANTSGAWYGIYNNAASVSLLNIKDNVFSGNTDNATTASFYHIYNSGASTGTITITGNQISQTFPGATAFSGTLYSIYNSAGTVATTLNISNNSFSNYSFTTASTGAIYFIYNTNSCANNTINGNTWNNLNLNSTGSHYLIYNNTSTQISLNVNNNSILTGYIRTGAAGTMYC